MKKYAPLYMGRGTQENSGPSWSPLPIYVGRGGGGYLIFFQDPLAVYRGEDISKFFSVDSCKKYEGNVDEYE
mgnify:CR=1 FL=1